MPSVQNRPGNPSNVSQLGIIGLNKEYVQNTRLHTISQQLRLHAMGQFTPQTRTCWVGKWASRVRRIRMTPSDKFPSRRFCQARHAADDELFCNMRIIRQIKGLFLWRSDNFYGYWFNYIAIK